MAAAAAGAGAAGGVGPGVSLKPIEVPQALQDGDKFIKWDEESGAGVPVTLRVDGRGFFLYWTDQNHEVELLELATVRDVRTGVHAKVPKDMRVRHVVSMGPAGALEDKTVTVCHGMDFVNVCFINFCCAKKEIAQLWTRELFALAYNLNQLTASALGALEKLHARIALRRDKQGYIQVKNIVRLFASSKEDRRRVEAALGAGGLPCGKDDRLHVDKFTFEDFFTFYKCLTQRDEVTQLFNQISGSKPVLSAAALAGFLNGVQRDPRLNEILHPYADRARAAELLRTHERNPCHVSRDQMTPDGFLRFLLSADSGAVAAHRVEALDLDQPLAHYYINSSHNTYLTGHQITGKSSVEIYRQTLLAGCRCVELDFWNGRTEEPVIVHGYTFVPEVPARDVLEAIAEAAFKTSDCPVILSFENHCNPRQQAKIATYCREIFGDMLLDRALDSHPLVPGGELPPPSALRRKIIIKNKKKHHHKRAAPPAPPAAAPAAPEPEPEPAEPDEPADPASAPAPTVTGNGDLHLTQKPRLARQSSSSSSSSSSGEDAAPASDEERETHAGAELSALVNYVQPVHFSSFDAADKKSRFYEMSSFDERQATALLKERPVEFVNYNKQQLSRVYPAGTRVKSTNFMPQVFWNAGCQLVALNFQTLDVAMMLNLGVFEYQRRCGYLLKPEFMRRKDRRLDPFAESTVDGIIAGSLSVRVVSAQLLSDRRASTYVDVELFGLPADTVRKRYRTRTVPNNAINPVYNDEPFVFKKVVLPELALLRLSAHEEGGRLLGHRVLPLQGLCPGHRHVPLRSEAGLPLPATLLLTITVKDYVPDQLSELAEALANPIKYQSELERREQQLAVLADDAGLDEGEGGAAGAAGGGGAAAVAGGGSPAHEPFVVVPAEPACAPAPAPAPAPPPPPPPTTAECLAAVLDCRGARDARAALARKLDQLRRKHQPRAASLVKRLSTRNMSEPAADSAGSLAAAERALRVRYLAAAHAACDKHLRAAHQAQLKELQDELEAEKKASSLRLAAARKEGVRALSKRRDAERDERERIKREIHKQSVERGVAERLRLEATYSRRRELLARQHERERDALHRHQHQETEELNAMYGPPDADG